MRSRTAVRGFDGPCATPRKIPIRDDGWIEDALQTPCSSAKTWVSELVHSAIGTPGSSSSLEYLRQRGFNRRLIKPSPRFGHGIASKFCTLPSKATRRKGFRAQLKQKWIGMGRSGVAHGIGISEVQQAVTTKRGVKYAWKFLLLQNTAFRKAPESAPQGSWKDFAGSLPTERNSGATELAKRRAFQHGLEQHEQEQQGPGGAGARDLHASQHQADGFLSYLCEVSWLLHRCSFQAGPQLEKGSEVRAG